MRTLRRTMPRIARALVTFSVLAAGSVMAQQAHTLLGVNCAAPPGYHCPDTDCSGPTVTQSGDTVELKTRRPFFLDCPADYKPGDKVNIESDLMAKYVERILGERGALAASIS